MKRSSLQHPSFSARRRAAPARERRAPWALVDRRLMQVGLVQVGALLAACGGTEGGAESDVPAFNGASGGPAPAAGAQPGAGQAMNGGAPAAGSTSAPEALDPNTPIDPGQTGPAAGGCTPNSASCAGNLLTRCDAAGAPMTEDCAASGGTCGDVAGVASCVAPACSPGAVTCAGANTIETCAADGSSATLSRCPDGTLCEGAGNCTPVTCDPAALTSFNGGEATVYWFGQGTINFGDIACGYGIEPGNLGNGDGDAVTGITNPTLFAAMNTANYRNAAACGACVEMNYQGRSVTVTVVDECPIGSNPTCTAGHIDLSRGAWNQLTGNAPGTQIFGVDWSFVPCPTTENVTFQLKEPDNQYWNEFLVRNHRYPIAKAEVMREDGTWVEAERQPYNYFHPPADDMGTYRVRATDINGAVVEEQLELAPGLQGGSAQFQCQ